MRHTPQSKTVLVSLALLALAACGGGGGGGGGGSTLPTDTVTTTPSVGIDAAAAGDQSALVSWSALDPQGQPLAVAIFGATVRNNVYTGAPLDPAPTGGVTLIPGLTNGQDFYIGLAIDEGGGNYSATGPIVRVVPNAPFYVDAASTAGTPDGLTPATAFPNLAQGVAAALGGGNVWVAAGTYADTNVVVPPDVHVYGGFESTFDLAQRDASANVTRLVADGTNSVLEVSGGTPEAVLDGLTIDGNSTALVGIDIDASSCTLRDVTVEDCDTAGVRASSASTVATFELTAVRLACVDGTSDGLAVSGGFDVTLDGCRFSENRGTGADLDALVALDNLPVRLSVRNTRCFGNGENGFSARLGAPAGGGANGSSFDVVVSGSTFEQNGTLSATANDGLSIDVDYETAVGWTSKIVVSGCRARANDGDGVLLDLDTNARTLVQRLSSCANGGDGVHVTSSTTDGLCTTSSSTLCGNRGYGVRADGGDVSVLVAHSVVSGNLLGGISSGVVDSSASSTIFWLQNTPVTLTRESGDVTETIVANNPFTAAPIGYYDVSGTSGSRVQLDSVTGLSAGDHVEIADDGTSRTIATITGTRINVAPIPSGVSTPTTLFGWGATSSANEDWSLDVGSSALGAGMPPAGGGTVDAGPFAGPWGGAPGEEDLIPPVYFFVSDVTPGVATALGAADQIQISFTNGIPQAATVDATTIQVRDNTGTILAPTLSVAAGKVQIDPPGGAWPSGDITVEVHVGLQATNGRPLAVPVAIPLNRP